MVDIKILGHEKVYVLNGGINEFEKIGGEVTAEETTVKKGNFEVKLQEELKVNMEYVKEKLYKDDTAIVDCRENARYRGEVEPVDKKAGHIPSALNYFWMDILNTHKDEMKLKSIQELKEYFKELNNYDEVIIYCGSGITACPVGLALNEAGIKHKLYAGSFSDWISYEDNKINTSLQ